jgi:hypothetical protein
MVSVSIDSGPIEPTHPLRYVPQDKWRDLMVARRRFMRVNLSYDCRCLVQFIEDAQAMYAPLGFDSADDMVRRGYELEPEEVVLALEWLRLNPSEAAPYEKALAERYRAIEAHDQQNKAASVQGQRTDLFDNKRFGVQEVRAPTGNAAAAALRRLRKDRPDIHERVLAGELTANAGMIEAGFRKKRESRKLTALDHLRKWWDKATPDQRAAFFAEISAQKDRAA